MNKALAATLFSATYVSAQGPQWPNCGNTPGFVNGLDACGCLDSGAVPVENTSICRCLDTAIMWIPGGSNCSLGTPGQAAFVNALRTRYEPFNNAASRATADRAKEAAVTAASLANAKADYEAKAAAAKLEWEQQHDAFWSWYPYRWTWTERFWWYNNQWWPITVQWKQWSEWKNYRSNVLKINNHSYERSDFIDAREQIEAKHEATPFTNQLDLIVGAIPNRPGAGFVPNSIWSSASSSNQLGMNSMGAVEARDPQLAYEFNTQWGNLNANVDDDQSWASASQSNQMGAVPFTQVESLFTEGNNMQWGALETRFNLP